MGRAQSLLKLVQRYYWTRGAELGLWRGQTSYYLLSHAAELHMIGVDLWQRTSGPSKNKETGHADYSNKDMEHAEKTCRWIARHFYPRLTIIKASTIEAATLVPNGSLDFIFIDAYHTTEAVMADYQAWRRTIKVGGAIIGHDADWPSVKRALELMNLQCTIMPGNVWVHMVH